MARAIFILEDSMHVFQAQRATHEYTQHNDAPPQKVFPLLCPVREADWVPGWQYHMIHSKSGVVEDGCVFATPNEDGPDTVWVVSEYEPAAFRVAFVWVRPDRMTCQIQIALAPGGAQKTAAHIRYTYTALSLQGNQEIAGYTRQWFENKMESWEQAINHYLRSGGKMSADAWK
jgi:hypothetical protein